MGLSTKLAKEIVVDCILEKKWNEGNLARHHISLGNRHFLQFEKSSVVSILVRKSNNTISNVVFRHILP